jgi:formylglycine-generating enzyme required for sulfatase activity/serine/threonine protein kinase
MKVLHEDLAYDRVFMRRFQREANTLAQLQHPNIVRFYGLEQDGPLAFMLLDYVDGENLKRLIFDAAGPMPSDQTLLILRSVCSALQFAHGEGMVHCDIKPGNIMIHRNGTVLLADFGIARMTDAATTTMVGMGTPAYMAPEQIGGLDPTAGTDIYALGIVLYEMLTGGERPFTGEHAQTTGSTSEKVRWEHIHLEAPSPRRYNPGISPDLEAVVLRCLEKDPEERFASAMELWKALQAAAAGEDEAYVVPILTEPPPTESMDVKQQLQACPYCGEGHPTGTQFCPTTGNDPGRLTVSTPPVRRWSTRPFGILFTVMLILGAIVFFCGGGLWLATQAGWGPLVPMLATHTPTPTITLDLLTPSAVLSIPTLTPENTNTPQSEITLRTTRTPVPLVTPTPTGGGGLIAFNSNRTGNNEIYLINADGSNLGRLTFSPADDRIPSWSPDGKEIAYQSNTDGDWEIYVLTLDGGRTRQVTSNTCNDYAPEWSPDGDRFVFYSDCDGNREIYTVNVDGSGRKQLTQTEQKYNWFPNWSPDGRQVTYSSNQSGNYQVYVMNADGSSSRALAPGCASSFSPDGLQILFTSYCTDLGEIKLMDADGSNVRTLSNEYGNSNPSWSRDGKMIVFQSDRSGDEDVWTMELDGSNWTQLTADPGRDSAAKWQPSDKDGSSSIPDQASSSNAGDTLIAPIDGMTMVYIPAGKFLRGLTGEDVTNLSLLCPECDPHLYSDQSPQREINLDGFWIDKTEVTNAQFAKFVSETGYLTTAEQKGQSYVMDPDKDDFVYVDGADWRHPTGPSSNISGFEDYPVRQISWDDAVAYCTWAWRRLPTETEWEKAARGTDGRWFPWGNDPPDKNYLNFNFNQDGPAPVGSYLSGASPYGVMDMSGNLWEWTADFYSESYYRDAPDDNPQGPEKGEGYILRGGSWASGSRHYMAFVTTTYRMWNNSFIRSDVIGFRCVMDIP